jgi:hypothetical protein
MVGEVDGYLWATEIGLLSISHREDDLTVASRRLQSFRGSDGSTHVPQTEQLFPEPRRPAVREIGPRRPKSAGTRGYGLPVRNVQQFHPPFFGQRGREDDLMV